MDRKTEILEYIKKIRPDDIEILAPIVDDMVFLENQLDSLRAMPFIEVKVGNPTKQRATPAAKMYKELLQQYNNAIKTVVVKTGNDESDEESPLRQYMKARLELR